MNRLKKLWSDQSGNILVLVSFAFTSLLGIAGLAVDGSVVYVTKTELKKVANAAALSAGQELTEDASVVRAIVDEVISKHQEASALEAVDVTQTDTETSVDVHLRKTVPLSFLSLFGFDSVEVKANAKAGLGVMARATGAAPLGINENHELTYGADYSIKVSSGDSVTGNFGILALEGKGANTYEQTFREGSEEEISVGDTILVQTGNIAGATRQVVSEKVQRVCSENDRDCSRVILVLVYQPVCADPATCTSYREVKITGFAYFYINQPMDEKDTAITGKFIKRVGSGFIGEAGLDRGAYTVRLLE